VILPRVREAAPEIDNVSSVHYAFRHVENAMLKRFFVAILLLSSSLWARNADTKMKRLTAELGDHFLESARLDDEIRTLVLRNW
jgi:hypothetical protein